MATKDHYKTVTEALTLFKDDPLISAPGTSYLYTTHGWTILSSVVESVAKQEFLLHMKNLFKDLGMENTCAEFNDKIIPHRARLQMSLVLCIILFLAAGFCVLLLYFQIVHFIYFISFISSHFISFISFHLFYLISFHLINLFSFHFIPVPYNKNSKL